MPRAGDIPGYAGVSAADRDPSGRKNRPIRNGAVRAFGDVISNKTFRRPGLAAPLDRARPNDTPAVIRPDRPDRSPRELHGTVDGLRARQINPIGPGERIDSTSAAGEPVFHVLGAIARFGRRLIPGRAKDGPVSARKHGRTPRSAAITARDGPGPPGPRQRRKIRPGPRNIPAQADQRPIKRPETPRGGQRSCFVPPWRGSTKRPSDGAWYGHIPAGRRRQPHTGRVLRPGPCRDGRRLREGWHRGLLRGEA